MKPIIGVIGRRETTKEKHKIYGIYEDIAKSIILSGGIPVCIPKTTNIHESLSICDGIIFQGGDSFTDFEKECIKYAYIKDMPTLGICLGMQLIGTFFEGTEYNTKNHKNNNKKYVHKILIEKKSLLFKILNKIEINVNSRHKSAIKNPKIKISAISEDNIIEAIENENRTFFLGVQWHPENLYETDDNSKKLFKYFINICNK